VEGENVPIKEKVMARFPEKALALVEKPVRGVAVRCFKRGVRVVARLTSVLRKGGEMPISCLKRGKKRHHYYPAGRGKSARKTLLILSFCQRKVREGEGSSGVESDTWRRIYYHEKK